MNAIYFDEEEPSPHYRKQGMTTQTPNFSIDKTHISKAVLSKAWRGYYGGDVTVIATVDELIKEDKQCTLNMVITASHGNHVHTNHAGVVYDGVFQHQSVLWVEDVLNHCAKHLDDDDKNAIASLVLQGVMGLAKPYILTKLLHKEFERQNMQIPQVDVLSTVLDDGYYLSEFMNRLPDETIRQENGKSYCPFLYGFLVKNDHSMIWL